MKHRCPGWGLTDCPDSAWVHDEDDDSLERDQCPACTKRHENWEASRKRSKKAILKTLQPIPEKGAEKVYRAMLRATHAD